MAGRKSTPSIRKLNGDLEKWPPEWQSATIAAANRFTALVEDLKFGVLGSSAYAQAAQELEERASKLCRIAEGSQKDPSVVLPKSKRKSNRITLAMNPSMESEERDPLLQKLLQKRTHESKDERYSRLMDAARQLELQAVELRHRAWLPTDDYYLRYLIVTSSEEYLWVGERRAGLGSNNDGPFYRFLEGVRKKIHVKFQPPMPSTATVSAELTLWFNSKYGRD